MKYALILTLLLLIPQKVQKWGPNGPRTAAQWDELCKVNSSLCGPRQKVEKVSRPTFHVCKLAAIREMDKQCRGRNDNCKNDWRKFLPANCEGVK